MPLWLRGPPSVFIGGGADSTSIEAARSRDRATTGALHGECRRQLDVPIVTSAAPLSSRRARHWQRHRLNSPRPQCRAPHCTCRGSHATWHSSGAHEGWLHVGTITGESGESRTGAWSVTVRVHLLPSVRDGSVGRHQQSVVLTSPSFCRRFDRASQISNQLVRRQQKSEEN